MTGDKNISRLPYRIGGKTIGTVVHVREPSDPTNPIQSLAGRDWFEAYDPSGKRIAQSNSRKLCQAELRKHNERLA